MRLTKKQRRKQKVSMTVKELERTKENATATAVRIVILFTLWILRIKYGFGEKRLREFREHFDDLFDSYNKGYITLPDIAQQLEKETNIRVDEDEQT